MKVATWNCNSVKARRERLLRWLERHEPDVLCLQELKVIDDNFPTEQVQALGYHCVVFGQKTYNGVAILSRSQPTRVTRGFAGDPKPEQARLLAADLDQARVLSVYVPNGSHVGSDKFRYKLAWLDALLRHLQQGYRPEQPLLVCGDFNIAPDERDVDRPEEWNGSVLCAPEARDRFTALLEWGLTDTLRQHHPEPGLYSWWDYRMLGFPKNNGLRIDHILATKPLGSRCADAYIDRDERKGKLPSDHAPVVAVFDEGPT